MIMRSFHCAALAAVAAIGIVSVASAADMSVKAPVYNAPVAAPAFSWTGFYLGGNVGGTWGSDKITSTTDPVGWGAAGVASIDGVSPTTLNPKGFIGGLQAGYNWQINQNWLLGIEADADWSGGSASRTLTYVGAAGVANNDFMANSTKSTFLATLRPRLGVTFDQSLLYVTGGLAIGTLQTTDSFGSFGGASVGTVNSSTTRTGWTVGGGFEYAFARNWSAKAEYLHVDLGNFNASIPSCAICAVGSDVTVNHKYTEEIARVGVNYLFH
jgi:outer membrane immunogenic protein